MRSFQLLHAALILIATHAISAKDPFYDGFDWAKYGMDPDAAYTATRYLESTEAPTTSFKETRYRTNMRMEMSHQGQDAVFIMKEDGIAYTLFPAKKLYLEVDTNQYNKQQSKDVYILEANPVGEDYVGKVLCKKWMGKFKEPDGNTGEGFFYISKSGILMKVEGTYSSPGKAGEVFSTYLTDVREGKHAKNMKNYSVPSDYSPIANFGALFGGAFPGMGEGGGLPQMGGGQSPQGNFPSMTQGNSQPTSPPTQASSSLVKVAQELLMQLGYKPGNVSGQMTNDTKMAIANFQVQNQMQVDAKVTPELITKLSQQVDAQGQGAVTAPAIASHSAPEGNALQLAQQACLEEAIAEAQSKKKKKKGFGSLMSAVSKTANLLGNNKFAYDLAKTTNDLYQVDSTVKDYKAAAKELGISPEAVQKCQNPQ